MIFTFIRHSIITLFLNKNSRKWLKWHKITEQLSVEYEKYKDLPLKQLTPGPIRKAAGQRKIAQYVHFLFVQE